MWRRSERTGKLRSNRDGTIPAGALELRVFFAKKEKK